MEFKEYIVKNFAPVVAILTSPETEQSCQEATGGSLADLLRPFASLTGLSGKTSPLPSLLLYYFSPPLFMCCLFWTTF